MSKVLITGATQGIGYAFAKYYASIGEDLYLVARNQIQLMDVKTELENQYHNHISIYSCDLSKIGSAKQLYEMIHEEMDIVINNAGVGYTQQADQIDIEKEEEMVVLNDIALMSLTKLFIKDMKNREQGTIINISSTGSFQPGPYIAGYYASKSFVTSYTRALHEEYQQYGLKVYCVCPGPVDTEFYTNSGMKPPKYAMQPDKVVKYTIKHMKNNCLIIPGFINRITRIIPEKIRIYFIRKSKWKLIKKKSRQG